jgi:hypothetical protein
VCDRYLTAEQSLDVNGTEARQLRRLKESWRLNDHYVNPGPVQFGFVRWGWDGIPKGLTMCILAPSAPMWQSFLSSHLASQKTLRFVVILCGCVCM